VFSNIVVARLLSEAVWSRKKVKRA